MHAQQINKYKDYINLFDNKITFVKMCSKKYNYKTICQIDTVILLF